MDQNDELRYLGYAGRLRTIARASTRYLAFTSDVGEAVRPVVPSKLVAAAYAVSFMVQTSLFSTWDLVHPK